LTVDESLATAGFVGGGATLGLVVGQGALAIQPFARAQLGSIDTGGDKAQARGLAVGVTVGTSF
jgi:hypothetical protein